MSADGGGSPPQEGQQGPGLPPAPAPEARLDLQNVLGKKGLTPDQALAALQTAKSCGRACYWGNLKVVMVDDRKKPPSFKQAKLQCIECEDILAATNPANLGASHFNNTGQCKKSLADGSAAKRLKTSSVGSADVTAVTAAVTAAVMLGRFVPTELLVGLL